VSCGGANAAIAEVARVAERTGGVCLAVGIGCWRGV
jgi:hypothetical protein